MHTLDNELTFVPIIDESAVLCLDAPFNRLKTGVDVGIFRKVERECVCHGYPLQSVIVFYLASETTYEAVQAKHCGN